MRRTWPRTAAVPLSMVMITGAMLVGITGTANAVCAWDKDTGRWADDGDPGGVSVFAQMVRTCDASDYYYADFRSDGEYLFINDAYADGHSAKVYLRVEGNGTATFTSEGDHNLSFDEGLDVAIKVCINGTDTCTAWSPTGTT